VILFAGTKLSTYGDSFAEKTGLGRTWVGVVLMAAVTSLPELITGVSSVTFFDLPDIAVGDVLGSCMFNILISALLDHKRGAVPTSSQAHQGQALTATYGILLLGLVSISGSHQITISAAILMTAIAIAGLTYRAGRKSLLFAWDSVGIMTIYALATLLLYLLE
jgi:Ca2+/Na+ antiporter